MASLTITAIPSSWCSSLWQWRNHWPGLSDRKFITTYPPAGTITVSFLIVRLLMVNFISGSFHLGMVQLFGLQPSLVQLTSSQAMSLLDSLINPVLELYVGYPTSTTWNVWPWRWIGWALGVGPIDENTIWIVLSYGISITWTHEQSIVDGLQSAVRLQILSRCWKSSYWVWGGKEGRMKLRPFTELVCFSPSKWKLRKCLQFGHLGYGSGSSLRGVGSSKVRLCTLIQVML